MKWLVLCVSIVLSCTSYSHAADDRPNIILIMADDFGYECVTANGGESYRTPNLDRLAAEGVRFEHCHVQPVCTPTRVQLMTGQHNVRNYLQFGVMRPQETTFGNLLRDAGYATGICGKWQLGRELKLPKHFGFDESYLWQHMRRPPRYANPGLELNGVEQDFTNGEYGPKLINDFAIDFVTRHRDQPFFLYYPMMLTHNPFQPTPDSADWNPAAVGERVNDRVKYFADMTAYMDKMVGELVSKLDELKIRERTLVLFIGDNGTHKSVTTQFRGQPYQGGKGTTTAHGTHVPCIANWPAVIKPGQVNRDLISSVDFLPTICDAAGVSVPDRTDGVSFLPQLNGETGTPRDWLYCWYSPRSHLDLSVREFAFDHNYKLYRTGELFDLATDPLEQQPIASDRRSASERDAAKKLQAALEQYQDARPAELDREFKQAMREAPTKKQSKKNRAI